MAQIRSHSFKNIRSDFNSENDAMSLCLGGRSKAGPDTSKCTVPGEVGNCEPEQISKAAAL